MVYAANFSIGVQLFYRLGRAAAEIFADFPMYQPYIHESHHRMKMDAPSGTAIELKRRVEPAVKGREVPVSSTRAGFIPGTHELGFDSEADTVIVRHTHGAQPPGLRRGSTVCGALGGRQEGLVHVRRSPRRRNISHQRSESQSRSDVTHPPNAVMGTLVNRGIDPDRDRQQHVL